MKSIRTAIISCIFTLQTVDYHKYHFRREMDGSFVRSRPDTIGTLLTSAAIIMALISIPLLPFLNAITKNPGSILFLIWCMAIAGLPICLIFLFIHFLHWHGAKKYLQENI